MLLELSAFTSAATFASMSNLPMLRDPGNRCKAPSLPTFPSARSSQRAVMADDAREAVCLAVLDEHHEQTALLVRPGTRRPSAASSTAAAYKRTACEEQLTVPAAQPQTS